MSDNLETAVTSFSEQTKRLNIALHYTNNDMDKAKQMIAGSYKDVVILKMKITSSSLYGAALLFFNVPQVRFYDSFFIVSNDYLVDNIENNQDWKTFEKDITNARTNVKDYRLINEIKDKFDRSMTIQSCTSIIKMVESSDDIQLTRFFQKFLQESTGLQRVDISLEFQKISSLEMELDSTATRKIDSAGNAAEQKKAEPEVQVESSDEVKAGVNGIKAIIRSTLILSPIKGKHIAELKVGDRVMISLIDLNDQNKSVAKAFNAWDAENNRILPIPSRIKMIKYVDGVGYKLYVVIAKGVLGEIHEEEQNIKVALDPAIPQINDEALEASSKNSIFVIIALFTVIVVLVGVILAMIFK